MNGKQTQSSEWFKYAEEDREVAEITLREDGPPNQVCFHTQQMAEKFLKGFLVLHGQEFAKQHQLPYLLELCEKIDPSFNELRDNIFLLNRFYIETRYPGNVPDFSYQDAVRALKAATAVKTFVIKKASNI